MLNGNQLEGQTFILASSEEVRSPETEYQRYEQQNPDGSFQFLFLHSVEQPAVLGQRNTEYRQSKDNEGP